MLLEYLLEGKLPLLCAIYKYGNLAKSNLLIVGNN
jgi:hypothetical protein